MSYGDMGQNPGGPTVVGPMPPCVPGAKDVTLHRASDVLARRGHWTLRRSWTGGGESFWLCHPEHGRWPLRATNEAAARTEWRRTLDGWGVSG